MLTDQGSYFLSAFMQKIAGRFRIKTIKTTAYYSQSDGTIESAHHVLSQFIKMYVSKDDMWDEWLEIATFSYNNSIHESTKFSPFEVLFGKPARLPFDGELTKGEQLPTYNNYIEDLVTRLIPRKEIRNIMTNICIYRNLKGI